MNTFFIRSLIACYLFCIPFLAQAQQASTDTKPQKIDYIINQMNIGKAIVEPTQSLHDQFQQNPFQLPDDANKKMLSFYQQAYAEQPLLSDFRTAFSNDFNPDSAQAVVQWLQSNQGQKIMNVRQNYYTIQGIRKRVVARYELEQHPAPKKRTTLMDSLATVTSPAQSTANFYSIIFRSVISGIDTLSQQHSFSPAQLDAITNNYKSRIHMQLTQQQTQQLLVMYYGTDAKYLTPYLSFYKTNAGQWLNHTVNQSMKSAYQKAAGRFIHLVQQYASNQ